jgi:hypothetical protein
VAWGQGFRPAAALPGGVFEAQIVGILSDFGGRFAPSQAEQKLGCTTGSLPNLCGIRPKDSSENAWNSLLYGNALRHTEASAGMSPGAAGESARATCPVW